MHNKKFLNPLPFLLYLLINPFSLTAQNPSHILLKDAKFKIGDSAAWKDPSYVDKTWETQQLGKTWQEQGHPDYHGYAWYRIHVIIPSSIKDKSFWKDSLRIFLAHVNDVDESYLNGIKIGHIGSFPDEPAGYVSKWPAEREYHLSINDPAIKWNQDNLIAIRVYDGGGSGGIFMGSPYLDVLERINGLKMEMNNNQIQYLSSKKAQTTLLLENRYNTTIKGNLNYSVYDEEQQKNISWRSIVLQLGPFMKKGIAIEMPQRPGIIVKTEFTETGSGFHINESKYFPYILTPPVSNKPRINGAVIFGVRPGHPILYKIPATGLEPLKYEVENMPKGLNVDPRSGIVTGVLSDTGTFHVLFKVKNKLGVSSKKFIIRVGNTIALTPAMGWNSWNCWGLSVSEEKVKSSAQAMIDKGLNNHGWSYINIDDGWESPQRAADGNIEPNKKFPSMKSLGDFLHHKGLKFGIYSSPGPKTCGGFLGSYRHELQDAKSYGDWGIDYLKYDWCSYSDVVANDHDLDILKRPYIEMRAALDSVHRDIYYSLCQYGWGDVWKWGKEIGGNSWRTTEDITDTWNSLFQIGFSQNRTAPYAHPGGWNDADMLIVGELGWGENLQPTRLTPDEQYTHISLWSLLSAPLLIGCDLSRLDKFTLNLLTNDEVIDLDQDMLGQSALRVINKDSIQVWVKNLADGSKAIGVFNTSTAYKKYFLFWKDLSLGKSSYSVRDIWRQKEAGIKKRGINCTIPAHGVFLIKVK